MNVVLNCWAAASRPRFRIFSSTRVPGPGGQGSSWSPYATSSSPFTESFLRFHLPCLPLSIGLCLLVLCSAAAGQVPMSCALGLWLSVLPRTWVPLRLLSLSLSRDLRFGDAPSFVSVFAPSYFWPVSSISPFPHPSLCLSLFSLQGARTHSALYWPHSA